MATVVSLVIAAILARLFSRHDYATYRQALMVYLTAAPILMLGLPQALYYFLPREKRRAKSVLLENLLLLLGTGGVFVLVILAGGDRFLASCFDNPDLVGALRIVAPYGVCMLFLAVLSPCLMALDRPGTVAVFSVISRVVLLISVLAACWIARTPSAALFGALFGAGIAVIPAFRLMVAACPGPEWHPRLSSMSAQLKYSIPLGMAAMVATLTLGLDKIIVSFLCGPELFAVYVNGAMEVPFVGIITASATAVILPDIIQAYKAGRVTESLDLWRRAAAKCALIIIPIMVFLFVTASSLIRLLYSEEYVESTVPFRIYLLILPTRIAVFGSLIMAANKNSWILLRACISLLINVSISVMLVWKIGYLGAAVGTVLTLWCWVLPYNLICIRRLTRARDVWEILPLRHLVKVFLASLAAVVPVSGIVWLGRFPALVTLVLGAAVYSVLLPLFLDRCGCISAKAVLKHLAGLRGESSSTG